MPWIVYVGSTERPPEPTLKLHTKEQAMRWMARLRARADVKKIPGVEIFIRPEDEPGSDGIEPR
jgi:hypothetical protein